MVRYWIAAGAALIMATPAHAQERSNWTGFYVGANAAGSRDRAHTTETLNVNQISGLFVTGRGIIVVPATSRDLDVSDHKTNFAWGGQLGYQWQTGNIVLGIEGDFDPSRTRRVVAESSQTLPVTALTPSTMVDSTRTALIHRTWSVRFRAGYAFDRTLAYATAGYVNARVRVGAQDAFTNPGGPAAPCTPNCTANLGPEGPNTTFEDTGASSRGGWTAGLGLEHRLTRHISVAIEYRHADIGGGDLTYTSSFITFQGPFTRGSDNGLGQHGTVLSASTHASFTSDAVGIRANFRF